MTDLTPVDRDVLTDLRDHAPATGSQLIAHTGRTRRAIDRSVARLAQASLITPAEQTDPDDPATITWTLTDLGAEHPALQLDTEEPADAEEPVGTDTDPAGTDVSAQSASTSAEPHSAEPDSAEPETRVPDRTDPVRAGLVAEQPKLCRGCQAQMPRICEHCWQKTTSYCRTCRRDLPQTRRSATGEPGILPNGLPRLRPGELEKLVLQVMRTHPVPDHVGITGWTAGRIAIYLPGRSTGAIGNALDKLTKTGDAQLLGENPMRYQPTAVERSGDTAAAPPKLGTARTG
jgi:hypothetical protein